MTTMQMVAGLGDEHVGFDSSADGVATLLDRHRNALVGLAVSLIRDREAAADAVQDVIEAVFRLEPVLSCEQDALTYARAAVVNRCRSVVRRRMTARRYLATYVPEPPAPGADHAALLSAQFQEVLAHLYRLPRRQREVLALRYFSGLSDAEIAATLHIAPSTVRASAARALHSLIDSVRKDSDD